MLKDKKVSIIMATFNRAHFITETLRSVQQQTFKNWECLIIDDGSTDNTGQVLEPFLNNDKRFHYVKRTDKYKKGLPGARNCGLDLAQGDYIIFFDDDDIVHPQNLEICVEELASKNLNFCRYLRSVFEGNFDYSFDLQKKYSKFLIGLNDIGKVVTNELPFNSCAVMWKKECFIGNRFVETLMYAEEWELYSRILSQGFKGVSIDKCLFFGRKHPNSNTGEYYKNNPIRVQSKKEAIVLVAQTLREKNLLKGKAFNHLIGSTIGFRDIKLLRKLITLAQLNKQEKGFLLLKFYMYPVWKRYKLYLKGNN